MKECTHWGGLQRPFPCRVCLEAIVPGDKYMDVSVWLNGVEKSYWGLWDTSIILCIVCSANDKWKRYIYKRSKKYEKRIKELCFYPN